MRWILLNSLLLFLTSGNVRAQTPIIDSLRNEFYGSTDGNKNIEIAIQICSRAFSLPTDTFVVYFRKLEQLSSPSAPSYFRAKTYYAQHLAKTGDLNSAFAIVDSLIKVIPESPAYSDAWFSLIATRGGFYVRMNRSKDAILDYLNMLQVAESKSDTLRILRAYNGMMYAKMELEDYQDAIKYGMKAIRLTNNQDLLKQVGLIYSNLGSCLNNVGKIDSAFYYTNLALKYGRLDENYLVIANALNIRAAMYESQNNLNAAEKDLAEAIEVRKKTYLLDMIVSDMAQLSLLYASLNKTDLGIATAKQGLGLIKDKNQYSKIIFLNKALAKNYLESGRYKEYAETLSSILNLNDTLNELNSNKLIAEVEAKYEFGVKNATILKQEIELQRNRVTIVIIALVSLSAIFIGFIVFRSNRQKQDLKMQLAVFEEKKNATSLIKIAEENERQRIAEDLHDNLGSYAAAISFNVKQFNDPAYNKSDISIQLEENAQSIVTQLAESIWVLKNNHIVFTQLADRYKVWLIRILANYPHIKYNYSEVILNDRELSSAKILDIYMILKECANNSLKHSDCTEINIDFFCDQGWSIKIEDNGKGFLSANGKNIDLEHKGNGISNINKRANKYNWQVQWNEVRPHGTIVILSSAT